MPDKRIAMRGDKRIALVAHDNKKRDLLEWAKYNRDLLAHHQVFATGTTGETLERQLGSSPLMDGAYDRLVPDYDSYRRRPIDLG